MTGKPVLAASASENVLFPDPASPVTMTRRPTPTGLHSSQSVSLTSSIGSYAISSARSARRRRLRPSVRVRPRSSIRYLTADEIRDRAQTSTSLAVPRSAPATLAPMCTEIPPMSAPRASLRPCGVRRELRCRDSEHGDRLLFPQRIAVPGVKGGENAVARRRHCVPETASAPIGPSGRERRAVLSRHGRRAVASRVESTMS